MKSVHSCGVVILIILFVVFGFAVTLFGADKPEPKQVVLTVSPEEVAANGGSAEVLVKWCIAPHPDNLKYSFAVVSDNNEYKVVLGDVGSEGSNAEETRVVRQGFYALEVCVYRRLAKKPICDQKFVEVK